jgi:hypothetical protein
MIVSGFSDEYVVVGPSLSFHKSAIARCSGQSASEKSCHSHFSSRQRANAIRDQPYRIEETMSLVVIAPTF